MASSTSSTISSSDEAINKTLSEESAPSDTVENILEMFNFPELIPTFTSKDIDVECLELLTEQDLVELIPKISVRIKFRKSLEDWKYSRSRHTLDQSSSEFSKCSSKNSNVNKFNLLDFLQSTNSGKSIIEYYKKESLFNEDNRKNLIKNITSHFVEQLIPIGTKDCCLLAEKIIELFPNEKKSSYFIPAIGNTNAKGALYAKYNNTLALYRRKGLVPKSEKPVKTPKTDLSSSPKKTESTGESEELSSADSADNDKEFLAKYNKPWDVVTEKWNRTFTYRRDDLLSSKTLQTFLSNWPLLRSASYGQLLVHLDFDQISTTQPNTCLSARFEVFIQKLISLCSSRLKSKEQKSLVKDLTHDDEETRHLAAFKALMNLLPPRSRLKRVDKSSWKPSIPDCIESVFLNIGPINNIDVKYLEFSDKAKTLIGNCQPVIGITDDNKYFVIVEGIYYPVDTLIAAVDFLFKIFFVLSLKYPPQSSAFYEFIQEYFYHISLKDKSSEVVSLLNQLV